MSTTASPALHSAQLTPDQLTVIAASFSSLILFVVIVALVSVIYRKDAQCCKIRPYRESRRDLDAPPQYYSSRQTLVGSVCLEQSQIINDSTTQQEGQLFYVGVPSSYRLPSLDTPLPRLPSYESVRKKDRQRQIHMMIAHRFGLNEPALTEPPPTYEESMRHSLDLPYDIVFSSNLDLGPPADSAVGPNTPSERLSQSSSINNIHNGPLPV